MNCELYQYDLCGRHGDRRLPLAFKFIKDGVEVDISNHEFYIELRSNYISPIRFKLGEGLEIVNNELIWDFGDSLVLDDYVYSYAIKIVENNQPITILEGVFNVKPEKVKRNV